MQSYYSMCTWVMDKQAEAQQRAMERRLLRQSRHITVKLRWPIRRQRDDR